ncbi:MAG TPA: GDP-mannose 4,6-dehydratase [Kofleriaceae bacterium]|nr:GDP-mannose 4,6-dehydratase [Kofleriaceae bacterium]
MKYVITGCFGFVGRYLVEAISHAEPDAAIVGVDRSAPPEDFPKIARAATFDLLDLAQLTAVIREEQPDRLVHLASLSSVGRSWHEPVQSFTNNTNIFLDAIECVRLQSPKTRVLSIGSSEQYGLVKQADLPLRETTQQRPLSPYAVARVAQEHLGDVYVRGYGLDLVATRSFNHVGARQSPQFVISALAKQFADVSRGRASVIKVGTTSVVRDFLDVRDVVSAYLALLANGARGEVYNICSGRGVSIADVIGILADIARVKPTLETDPQLVRPVENEVVIGDHGKITAAVGWRPTITLETALQDVYDYWRDQP